MSIYSKIRQNFSQEFLGDYYEYRMTKFKYDYDDVKQLFQERGCTLLSESYSNNKTKLQYRCKCGNVAHKTLDRFLHSKGECSNCVSPKQRDTISISEVKKQFASHGCKLLETEYVSFDTPMKFICKCGNIAHKKLKHINPQLGIRCKQCSIHHGESHPMWNPDREAIRLRKIVHDRCRAAVRNCIRRSGQIKCKPTHKYVRFTDAQLIERLKSFPSWETLRDSDWALDHIFPVKAFLDHQICDPEIINCLDNLQPLSREENLRKADSYNETAFLTWLNKFYEQHPLVLSQQF